MTSLPVIFIKDSTDPLQSDFSKSAQYVPASEPSESLEPSAHPKALCPISCFTSFNSSSEYVSQPDIFKP
jgi:hypothetical protein